MIFPPVLTEQLTAITKALYDPGTDLQAVLDVLLDDLSAAICSFLGVSVRLLVDEFPVTLTAINPGVRFPVGASLQLPPAALTGVGLGGTMVFYARNPGAFVDLAADIDRVHGPGVVLDGHLAELTGQPPLRSGITGLADLSLINQAVGVLITRGYDPGEALAELRSRAADTACGVPDVARQVLACTNTSPRPAAG